jgi:hypothetical protein
VSEAIELGAQVAAGLAAVHAAGVVHGDLKPSNVFLTAARPSQAVVMDLGLARVADRKLSRRSSSSLLGGTPGYLAPEQLTGARAHRGSDIWAFGVLLREMLTGEKPTVLGGTQPGARAEDSRAVPGALGALIDACLVPHPAGRPASTREVVEALAHLSQAELRDALAAARPSPFRRGVASVPSARRRARALVGVGARRGCARRVAVARRGRGDGRGVLAARRGRDRRRDGDGADTASTGRAPCGDGDAPHQRRGSCAHRDGPGRRSAHVGASERSGIPERSGVSERSGASTIRCPPCAARCLAARRSRGAAAAAKTLGSCDGYWDRGGCGSSGFVCACHGRGVGRCARLGRGVGRCA